jgi:aldose 1-epimerase
VPSPSGQQVEISAGDQRATIVEVGGGIRTYHRGEWAVLDGYEHDHMCDGGRGQPLLPWPNRLADGRYSFGGDSYQLPIDEVALGNSIHGLTRWASWTATEVAPDQVTMALTLHPRPGYPFELELRMTYALSQDGLSVRTRATNVGVRPLPFGAGYHPYVAVGPLVDDAELRVPARYTLATDERQLPTGEKVAVDGGALDFRSARRIGALKLDTCFTGFERDADGLGTVEVRGTNGRGLSVWFERSYEWLMVFTGDTLAPARRRQGLALEPMTCPANAFRSGVGLLTLAPGATFDARWGIRPRG